MHKTKKHGFRTKRALENLEVVDALRAKENKN